MYKGRFVLSVLMMALFIAPQAQAENTLTLEDIYQTVLDKNPQIQSHLARIMAAEGNRLQQSLMPNPEAVFEADNFGGDSPRNGIDEVEYTLGVAQKIEISGKRTKREHVANIEKKHVVQEAQGAVQSILAQTNATYMRVAIAQEKLRLAEIRMEIANKTHTAVKERVNAAKSSDIQHTKTDLEVLAAEIEQRNAQKELFVTKIALANLMGLTELDRDITADPTYLADVPERNVVLKSVQQAPISVMSQLSVMREDAALSLARANGKADPIFGLGVRRFSEDDSTAFLASVTIPINIFDRNQGRIAEARSNLLAAKSEQTAQRLQLEMRAMEMWQTLISEREELRDYEHSLLPSAQRAFTQAQDGFNKGSFPFLDLLDAQRTLFDTQENYLETLASFHANKTQIDLLTGVYAQISAARLNQNTTNKE